LSEPAYLKRIASREHLQTKLGSDLGDPFGGRWDGCEQRPDLNLFPMQIPVETIPQGCRIYFGQDDC
jgi:hypothetical protein